MAKQGNDKIIRKALESADSDKSGDISQKEAKKALKKIPKKPPFPMIWFMVCALIDCIDIASTASDLTGVGAVIYGVLKFVFTVVELIYVWRSEEKYRDYKAIAGAQDLAAGAIRKGAMGKIAQVPRWLKLAGLFGEAIPILKYVPFNTLFMFLTYNNEKKNIRALRLVIARLGGYSENGKTTRTSTGPVYSSEPGEKQTEAPDTKSNYARERFNQMTEDRIASGKPNPQEHQQTQDLDLRNRA